MATGNSPKRALTESPNSPGDHSIPLPNLPEEIVTEILLRFPVKSLLKFRCVCKSWRSLIATPEFINSHLAISTKNNIGRHNRLIFGSGPCPRVFHTFSLHPKIDECLSVDSLAFDSDLEYDAVRIVGSCNGLVCAALALDDCSLLVLWNPATRKLKQFPISDSNRICTQYGFGYDADNDDYKIVESSMVYRDDQEEHEVRIYSCRRNSWRNMENWPQRLMIFDGPGVFVNGAIHWKMYDDVPSNWVVSAMNVTTEASSRVELPRRGSDDASVLLGVVSGGYLCTLYDYGSYMDVWIMREYGVQESWTKLVCYSYYFCMGHSNIVRPKMLFVSQNGGILLSLGSDLIAYGPPNCHEVHRLGNNVKVEGITYSESLLSPNLDCAVGR